MITFYPQFFSSLHSFPFFILTYSLKDIHSYVNLVPEQVFFFLWLKSRNLQNLNKLPFPSKYTHTPKPYTNPGSAAAVFPVFIVPKKWGSRRKNTICSLFALFVVSFHLKTRKWRRAMKKRIEGKIRYQCIHLFKNWILQRISPLFIEQLIKNKRTSNKLKHDRNT